MSLLRTLAVPLVALSLSACKAVSPDALPAAQAWLALVDDGQYAQSWTESASTFQAATTSDGWAKQVGAVRAPLGMVRSRTVSRSVATSSVPGGPDGEYVVFTFDTTFEHKAGAIETVTPMKDKDGRWRVTGYYIR